VAPPSAQNRRMGRSTMQIVAGHLTG
jgi:hypothetical protein